MAVAKRRGRREKLSRERIVAAALALIEEIGYDDFSTRKLAAALGCEAMSLYHYFPSMEHLRDALFDRCLATMETPPRELPWTERLWWIAHAYRAMALRNPRFFHAMALHRTNTATGLRFLETILEVFRDAGFGTATGARLFRAFGYYISGAALDEAAGYAKGPSAVEPVPDDVAARDYPLVTAVNPYFKPAHHEATFEAGLEIMLAGIARHRRAAGAKAAAGKGGAARARPAQPSRRAARPNTT